MASHSEELNPHYYSSKDIKFCVEAFSDKQQAKEHIVQLLGYKIYALYWQNKPKETNPNTYLFHNIKR